jgi:hypothetical protein
MQDKKNHELPNYHFAVLHINFCLPGNTAEAKEPFENYLAGLEMGKKYHNQIITTSARC